MKNLLVKFRAQTTPEQQKWVVWALFISGCGFLWRAAQSTWPSTWLSLIGIVILVGAVICFIKLITTTPELQSLMVPTVTIFVGGFLNLVALIANNGFMPSAGEEAARGIYCPIDGANLAYLGDWIPWGFLSPGDVLVCVGVLGVVVTLIRNRQQNNLVEQT